MQTNDSFHPTDRREFLGTVAGSAAALSLSTLLAPFSAAAEKKFTQHAEDADAWFAKIKGKHRIVFDCTEPQQIFPFVWPKVFLLTNAATGSPEKDCSVVVILRHNTIGYAMQDNLWAKYKFADLFKIGDVGPAFRAADAATATATRNPFWNTKPGDFMMPVFGELPIGIKDLQASGVMFCACDAALTVYSGMVAMQTNGNAADIKKEWVEGLIPGVQVVPSGVWAVGRAQEHGCAYCFVA
ncbi:MAG TPA: hypothetical protein VNV85_04475 [Puia sp.]|jgi:hypothetical protein|nr:hypothetical protein [Puia sp.]